jgi:hypothetical protein
VVSIEGKEYLVGKDGIGYIELMIHIFREKVRTTPDTHNQTI